MDAETLKFLLDAQTQLQGDRAPSPLAEFEDLQAVERALPDTDWFELEEVRELPARPGAQAAAGLHDLEF